jgi:hypothetical protein
MMESSVPPWVDVVVAVDPGKMTGIAIFYVESGDFVSLECNFIDTCRHLLEIAAKYRDKMILIVESFIIGPNTAKNTQAPWSLELIGVCRCISQVWCDRDVHVSQQSAAMRFSSNTRLKHVGWYKPGKGHGNDAARHLLLVMVTRGWLGSDTVRSLVTVVD